jgi:glycerol-3-phosphate dehydrogenase
MNRTAMLQSLASGDVFDVVVIGGGATGLGAAVDAASRGYKTALFEARDFAQGTSSRSTKLVHGGVRYLAQGHISLVREALHERERLIENAPHLVHAQPFILPTYQPLARWYYATGLKLYDLLASSEDFPGARLMSRREVATALPGLRATGLTGGVMYYDGQFDDARLAINLAQTFADLGGTIVNYCPVETLIKTAGQITGLTVRDEETDDLIDVRGRSFINATGVFSDAIRRLDEPAAPASIVPSQGAHIVLDRSFLGGEGEALMIPKTDDGRILFAIPWHGRLLVGTTDTPRQQVDIEPRTLDAELEFLVEHAGRYLARKPSGRDILSTFAGLRPLAKPTVSKKTKNISRDMAVSVSASGLITITGGKWTTYRHMGEVAVDHAITTAGLTAAPCRTAKLAIHGAAQDAKNFYGSDAPLVDALAGGDPELLKPYDPNLPVRPVDVIWAARREMARRLEDVLSRRTRCLLLDALGTLAIAPRVAELLAHELGRDHAWAQRELSAFKTLASGYIVA